MEHNTATYRKLAQAAEDALDWTRAADYYSKAIEVYPQMLGSLAKADVKAMAGHRDSCIAMANNAGA